MGSVAYQIDNTNGCMPVDGLAYLQRGARAHGFRVVQAVTFLVVMLFVVLNVGSPDGFNAFLAFPALAELVYTAVVASKGTPVVVSGDCLLVELNPRVGFLDSSISTDGRHFYRSRAFKRAIRTSLGVNSPAAFLLRVVKRGVPRFHEEQSINQFNTKSLLFVPDQSSKPSSRLANRIFAA